MGKKDLIGTRIGSIVVSRCIDDTVGDEKFECRCDCGNIISVKRRYLVDKTKTHCGCMNKKDMVGQRVGMLTVISFAGIGKHGTALWNCRCDCGGEKVVDGALLRSGGSISCGCLHKIKTREAKKKYNNYVVDGNIVRVKLSNSDREMICDVDDWERLKQYCWCLGTGGYARTNVNDDKVFRAFHLNVIDCPDGLVCDHINRNRLDNRKCNLRAATYEVNARNTNISKNNTSGYKGVTRARSGRYIAQIGTGHDCHYLGRYDSAEEAYKARLAGEEKYFGKVYSAVTS